MKKKIILLLMCITMILGLTACGDSDSSTSSSSANTRMYEITGQEDLCYDINTKIVYYYFRDKPLGYAGYGFMSPYISENGNFCKYNVESQTIEEIKE